MYIEIARYQEDERVWIQQDIQDMNVYGDSKRARTCMYIEIARYQEDVCIWIQQDIKNMNILYFLMDWYIDIARDITTPRQMSMSHELADELWRHVCMHIYVNIYSCMYIDIARDITTPRQLSMSHDR